ncbi:MAG TPA: hypothetical protein VH255_08315 [Verrucomicrobiae bacterium]|jgi:hypothetical protein|nr:hypothetical protein [Verrucomicrobiae bacterium]
MKPNILLALLCTVLLNGCATQTNEIPPGTLNSDGTGGETLYGSHRGNVATPKWSFVFNIYKDSREWKMQSLTGDRKHLTCEFSLKGAPTNAWQEKVLIQIVFMKFPLRKFIDGWEEGLRSGDAHAQTKETTCDDGSITVEYTVETTDIIGVRRFIQGGDGIYMIAYHVHRAAKDAEIYKLWTGIINTASLEPHQQK